MRRSHVPFLVLPAVALLVIAAFTWPAALSAAGFDVRAVGSDGAARAAVRDREAYGALSGRTLYVATGASPAVAAGLRQAAPPGARVVDLAPGTARDPRVATLPALALPMILLGIVSAIAAFFTARTTARRLALLATGAGAAGLGGALLTHTWLDALPGDFLALAGALALAVFAVGATVAGLASRLGRPGIGLGAVLMMLVGNPWSGIGSAPELLPEPAGAIGALLPAGAGGNLLRSVAYFDGAGGGEHLLVLGLWALAGVALLVSARARAGAPHAAPAPVPAAA